MGIDLKIHQHVAAGAQHTTDLSTEFVGIQRVIANIGKHQIERRVIKRQVMIIALNNIGLACCKIDSDPIPLSLSATTS